LTGRQISNARGEGEFTWERGFTYFAGGGLMTRRISLFLCGVLLMDIGGSFAHELGDFGQYPRGITIGDPVGAALPPGLYFENISLFVPSLTGYGQWQGVKVTALVDVPMVLWSPGWTFLGGNVMAFVAQPMAEISVRASNTGGPPFAPTTEYPTVFNTWINPLAISWNLGSGWFSSVGVAFHPPIGSSYNNTANPDYWTYETRFAVSYLADGWNLTAHLAYDINSASAGHTGVFAGTPIAAFGVGYRSGDQAFLDLTATKKFGAWEIGPVAYFKWQTSEDRPGGGVSCAGLAAATSALLTCGRATDYAIGGLVGYDFGPVAVKAYFTHSVYTRDDVGGFAAWTKLSFRLWGPEPPPAAKPIITKAK
jgi:hypothetical protein